MKFTDYQRPNERLKRLFLNKKPSTSAGFSIEIFVEKNKAAVIEGRFKVKMKQIY